jgi:hypothetical protein
LFHKLACRVISFFFHSVFPSNHGTLTGEKSNSKNSRYNFYEFDFSSRRVPYILNKLIISIQI